MRTHTLAAVTISVSALVIGAVRADVWSEAEKQIVRLEPMMFNELPSEIVKELKALKCTVPQTYENSKPHNVISGSFAEKNQTDWAVLCSRNGVSSIKIFWGGAARCPSEISESQDKNWLQGIGNDKIGYSRAIEPASKKAILEYHKEYGGPTPPPISHQGIDDYFVGKASVVHYCSDGKWIALTGAD
jgi:hypothetical protein